MKVAHFFSWIFIFFALVIINCAENQNPVITDRKVDNIPVSALKFVPQRKYITQSDSVPVLVKGYNKGFACSQIDDFGIDTVGDTLWPFISAILPESIDDCPIIDVEGEDSLVYVSLEDRTGLPGMIYLENSVDSVTDSAVLIKAEHRSLFADSGIIIPVDLALAENAVTSSELLPDFLEIPCGDSVSYGCYCTSAERGSLYLQVKITGGWEEAGCDSSYTYVIETEYFHEVQADSALGCAYSMVNQPLI